VIQAPLDCSSKVIVTPIVRRQKLALDTHRENWSKGAPVADVRSLDSFWAWHVGTLLRILIEWVSLLCPTRICLFRRE
jgi:hypothetical protein